MNNMTTIMESWRKNSAEFDDGLLSEEYNKLIQKNSELADAAFLEAVFGIKPIIAESGGFDVATQRLILKENKDLQDILNEEDAGLMDMYGALQTLKGSASILRSIYSISKIVLNPQSGVDHAEALRQFGQYVARKTRSTYNSFIREPFERIQDFLTSGLGRKIPNIVRRPVLEVLNFIIEKVTSMMDRVFNSDLATSGGLKGFMVNIGLGSILTLIKLFIGKSIEKAIKFIDKFASSDKEYGDDYKEFKALFVSMKKKVGNVAENVFGKLISAAYKTVAAFIGNLNPIVKVAGTAVVDFFDEPFQRLRGNLSA